MKNKKGSSWKKIKDYFRINKKNIPVAAVFFLACIILFIWPIGLVKEDKENYLPGLGSWQEPLSGNEFRQVLSPEYKNVKSIGVALTMPEENAGEGIVTITLTDYHGNRVYEQSLDYKDIENGYNDLDLNLKLNPLKRYTLTVKGGENLDGEGPSIGLCDRKYFLPETKKLSYDSDLSAHRNELLMRFRYSETLPKERLVVLVLLFAVMAVLIAWDTPKNETFRKCAGIVLMVAGPLVLGSFLEHLTIKDFNYFMIRARMWSYGLMYFMEAVILLLSLSYRWSIIVTDVFLTLFFTLNYYVCSFRGAPLHFNDFKTAGTAVEVAGQYSYAPDSALTIAWCITAIFIILAIRTGIKYKTGWKKRVILACTGIAALVVAKFIVIDTPVMEKTGLLNERGWAQNWNYTQNGLIMGFCFDVKNSSVKKVEGYSKEAAEGILAGYRNENEAVESDAELPHIILIMNETWSDLRVLGNLEVNEEFMPFYYSLEENAIKGCTNASVKGGGTANSEFEVFTGCSMGFLPSAYYPYLSAIHSELPSMISNVKTLGYTAYSMHPAKKSNWSREQIYPYFGFDESFWKEDFSDGEIIHSGVSDRDTYRKVQEIFENKNDGEKLFIFDLTIQNHGGYNQDLSNVEPQNYLKNSTYLPADLYLTLMRETDQAFEELIDYFDKIDEKVIICMFGDHQPNFEDKGFYEGIFQNTPGLTEQDRLMNQYKTPFVIWANYDIEEKEGLDISLNYLGVLLFQTADLPMSPYFNFLANEMEKHPIITVNGYADADGTLHSWKEESGEFNDYKIVQYDYLFGKRIDWGY